MLKIIIGAVALAVVGVGAGIGILMCLGSLEEPPEFVEGLLGTGEEAEVESEGPFFYNVQSWFEFTTPAGSETLGNQHVDLEAGIQFSPPAGMVEVSPEEIEARAAERPDSRLRMTNASFDMEGIVWMFESEDGETTVTVRQAESPLPIGELEYEQLFNQYRAATVQLLEGMGVEDYRIEAAFFSGGMGIYTKFASPGPDQQVIHMVQVVGSPSDQTLTVMYARPVDGLTEDWESIVQASMETISSPGSLVQ